MLLVAVLLDHQHNVTIRLLYLTSGQVGGIDDETQLQHLNYIGMGIVQLSHAMC